MTYSTFSLLRVATVHDFNNLGLIFVDLRYDLPVEVRYDLPVEVRSDLPDLVEV